MRALTLFCRFIAVLVLAGIATSLTVAALTPTLHQFLQANDAQSSKVKVDQLANNSFVFAADNSYVGTLHGPQNRELITLDNISEKTVDAILAVEDADFYVHNGVNARSIVRALITNVNAGSISQGGSTITQQVVKNLVLDDNRQQVDRKIPEAALALRLEDQMSKRQILELYLNTVYFGAGAYGVQTAAKVYFDKAPKDLDWPESALLASLISSPSSLDPTRNPDGAQRQRRLALRRVEEEGYITAAERKQYEQAPLPAIRTEQRSSLDNLEDGYFLEEVKQQLLKLPALGDTQAKRIEAIFAGGLRIHTTFDPSAQATAERAVAETLAPINDDRFTAALAAVEPGTGAVRALVGGPGFDKFKFDIATQKGRPTGSSIKAFVLSAAMEAGVVPSDTIDGTSPCEFANKGGTPDPYIAENFSGAAGSVGDITAQTLRSSNCAYLRIAQVVGLNNVISTAHALGVTSRLDPVLTLPLGVFDVTPLDMANSYASIANDGVRVDPYFVDRIEDRDGKVLYRHVSTATRAISVQSSRLVTQVLEKNVIGGTGTKARLPAQPAAGKTGTSSDFTDAWFVGFTPYLATAVWMGNPDASVQMRNVGGVSGVTGGSFPAAIWGNFNTAYHENREVKPFLAADSTRAGRTLRTAADVAALKQFARSSCGEKPGEDAVTVDANGDGVPDACAAGTAVPARDGACPALLFGVDDDGDGTADRCVSTPPSTTVPPTTTLSGGTTTSNVPTTVPNATTSSHPPNTSSPPTTAPTTTAHSPPTTSRGGTTTTTHSATTTPGP